MRAAIFKVNTVNNNILIKAGKTFQAETHSHKPIALLRDIFRNLPNSAFPEVVSHCRIKVQGFVGRTYSLSQNIAERKKALEIYFFTFDCGQ